VTSSFSRAGQWFLRSGIQESNGGVARYYRADLDRNQAVSTEITGYAVSALLYLHAATGDDEYRNQALSAARFLCRDAWDGHALPFEVEAHPDSRFAYFFDCGIVVRGLLAAWRASGEVEFLQVATALGRAMARDFRASDGEYHPILKLPEKQPVERDPVRWSRAPGCYQLKSAMAWLELREATGETCFGTLYDRALENSLRGYGSFLPGHPDRLKVVDRLHAFLYFLEGLLPRLHDKQCATALCRGISIVAQHLNQMAPEFERSDVYAQLLRIRLYADWAGVAPLDREAANQEASALAEFQIGSGPSRVAGGFYFGRQGGQWLPYINPVSAAFALQALALWDQHQFRPELPRLVI
jgi:hypothetical protein